MNSHCWGDVEIADIRNGPPTTDLLADWLDWLEVLHPTKMDLSLDRVAEVTRRLRLDRFAARVVTIAGTNGKGSTTRLLEAALQSSGLLVGSTTSPHLFKFNERICIAGVPVSDQSIVDAFRIIAANLAGVTLTYYEFAVLAALWLMREAEVDVALLEVGLGGRLDAVNVLSADIAVITHIGIDHTTILGTDRESIGAEKAGIFRTGKLAIIGDPEPPASVLRLADSLAVKKRQCGMHFYHRPDDNELVFGERRLPAQKSVLAMDNVLTAMATLHYGFPALDLSAAYDVMLTTTLAGRMQAMPDNVWLDVAHNPGGARHLVGELAPKIGAKRVYCLYATLKDKNAPAFVCELHALVDGWYIGGTTGSRGRSAMQLTQDVATIPDLQICASHEDLDVLLEQALTHKERTDALLICGSFELVAHATRWLEK